MKKLEDAHFTTEEEREIETRMASVIMFVVQKKQMGFSKKDQRNFLSC